MFIFLHKIHTTDLQLLSPIDFPFLNLREVCVVLEKATRWQCSHIREIIPPVIYFQNGG